MILSVSRRTDIPAFFSEWFFNRVKAGEIYVRNPMNIHQVSRIDISPRVTDCIVFWTKNAKPMISRLDELKDYMYYFQFTVNAYDKDVEPMVPPLSERTETFRQLSDMIGKERIIWRYDPIFISEKYDLDFHINSIERIAESIGDKTEKCVFSFVDIYPTKNQRNMLGLGARGISDTEMEAFLGKLCGIAEKYGFSLATCAEKIDLERYGIEHNSCIDGDLIQRLTGYEIKTKPDGQRGFCRCVKCEDIGSYDTCMHGCLYCYANYKPDAVKEKLKAYDPQSPILCDKLDPLTDKITDRPVKLLRGAKLPDQKFDQMSLF